MKSIGKAVQSEKASTKTTAEEISVYGSLCRKNPSIDAITFWKTYGEQLPLLKEMGQTYLPAPGTSVPSESAFSLSDYVGRKERAQLGPENLSYSIFLRDKLLCSLE